MPSHGVSCLSRIIFLSRVTELNGELELAGSMRAAQPVFFVGIDQWEIRSGPLRRLGWRGGGWGRARLEMRLNYRRMSADIHHPDNDIVIGGPKYGPRRKTFIFPSLAGEVDFRWPCHLRFILSPFPLLAVFKDPKLCSLGLFGPKLHS